MLTFWKRHKLMQILHKSANIFDTSESLLAGISDIKFFKNKVHIIYNTTNPDKQSAQILEQYIVEICLIAGFEKSDIIVVVSNEKPTPPSEVESTKSLSNRQNSSKKTISRNIIVIASCKGGVGKSTIAANIAGDLAQSGKSVGLIDADIYGPSIPIIFNIENQKHTTTSGKLDPIIHNTIQIASIGLLTANIPLLWRGPMITKAIKSLFEGVNWQNPDTLIVDLPPGTGDVYLSVISNYNIGGAILVSTPDTLSVSELEKSILMFKQFDIPIIGIIENRSNSTQHHLTTLANKYDLNIIAHIPEIKNLTDSHNLCAKFDEILKNHIA